MRNLPFINSYLSHPDSFIQNHYSIVIAWAIESKTTEILRNLLLCGRFHWTPCDVCALRRVMRIPIGKMR